ncbi:MAG: hypothetical protein WC998_04595 [Candidatus Paceibacterota bacterium]|jgi:hypothetical protein
MAWTAPRTWVTGEIVSAAMLNSNVRDNVLETAPGKAAAAGDIFVATGANAIKRVAVGSAGSVVSVNSAGNDVQFDNTLEILSLLEV